MMRKEKIWLPHRKWMLARQRWMLLKANYR